MAEVGDGLCLAVRSEGDSAPGGYPSVTLIDWGGTSGRAACEALGPEWRPNVFVLSHYHRDHYNGLLYAAYPPRVAPPSEDLRHSMSIGRVYYPGLPRFVDNARFLKALISVSLRTVGEESGVQEYDFLRALRRLSYGPFSCRPVFKGDVIEEGGLSYRVLWPPNEFNRGRGLKVVENALKKFQVALGQDARLRKLYERVSREGLVDYIESSSREKSARHKGELAQEYETVDEGAGWGIGQDSLIEVGGEDAPADEDVPEGGTLPASVRDANKALRTAANHMCLVLAESDRLLMMGDVEQLQIKRVTKNLVRNGATYFFALVTPHHGTHWDESLRDVQCLYSLSSNGERLFPKMRLEFKEISEKAFATHLNGDLHFQLGSVGWRNDPWLL